MGQDLADLVVEDLGRSAGHAAEAGVAQHAQVVLEGHVRTSGSVEDLHRREGVHVDLREGRLDRDEDIPVVERAHLRVDAALHADFGRPPRDRFFDLGENRIHPVVVGVVLPALPFEGAELAVHEADVREVDVAVHDVRHVVADILPPDLVRGCDQGPEIVVLDAQEDWHVGGFHVASLQGAVEDRPDGRARRRDRTLEGPAIG